jgi:hypothetical protein
MYYEGGIMVQLYFLSLVFNGLAGFFFIFGDLGGNNSTQGEKKFSFVGDGFRLVIGILAAVTGILKLFAPMVSAEKAPIYILGDLLPALAGIAAGFLLMFGFYRERSTNVDTEEKVNSFGDTFLQYKKAAGVVILVIALLHFLLPGALFL